MGFKRMVLNLSFQNPPFRGFIQKTPSTNVNKIIDHVYGLDYIVQLDPTGERVGIDFTVNPQAISEKIEKAKSLASLWRTLGVSKVVILLTTYPSGDDRGIAFYNLEEAQNEIENIMYEAVDGVAEVTSATVHVTR